MRHCGDGIWRGKVFLSQISVVGHVAATGRFHCWRELIFGIKNESNVWDKGSGSQEKSMGWACNHFNVVAIALYEAGAIIGTLLKQPLPPSRMPNLICFSAFW